MVSSPDATHGHEDANARRTVFQQDCQRRRVSKLAQATQASRARAAKHGKREAKQQIDCVISEAPCISERETHTGKHPANPH